MLTDSVSQFETNDVNHIPRSLQKLISDLQKAQGKKPQRNPPLNITSVKKAKNKSTTIRKKRQLNKKPDLNEDFEENDDSVSKNSGIQIIDQRSITDFFKTVKNNNLLNSKRSNETINIEKQNDSDIEEIIFSDEEPLTTQNQRQITKIKQPNFSSRNQIQVPKLDQNSTPRNPLQIGKFNDQNSLAKFQNNEYLNLMSSGRKYNPYSNEIFDRNIGQCGQNETEKFNKAQTATATAENWKTFNDIVTTDTNFDLPDKRRKGVISDLFYKNTNSYVRDSAKEEVINQTVFPTVVRNERNTMNSSSDNSKNTAIHDFIKSSKDDHEKMNNLLQQLKSVNNVISKARQEITKFCSSGK